MQKLQSPISGAGAGTGMAGTRSGAGISISLVQSALWSEFHAVQNEMILTKTGRKIFPKLEIDVRGLNPSKKYGIHMRLERVDEKKYRFNSSTWSAEREDDDACFPLAPPVESNNGFAQIGESWMSKTIEFSNFKITNNMDDDCRGMVLLQPLRKHVPVIYVYEMGTSSSQFELVARERLTLAEFIPVTAYQNEEIKKLKLAHNPFARAFMNSASCN